MKRDFELVRKIIRYVADANAYIEFPAPRDSILPEWGTTGRDLAFHVNILIDAKYIIGIVTPSKDSFYIEISRLTWDGCEFYESSADNDVWNKAMKTIKTHTPKVTLHVLQTVLARIITNAVVGNGLF